jgi:hypothetical protein
VLTTSQALAASCVAGIQAGTEVGSLDVR